MPKATIIKGGSGRTKRSGSGTRARRKKPIRSSFLNQFRTEDISLTTDLDTKKSIHQIRKKVTKRKQKAVSTITQLKKDKEIFSLRTELAGIKGAKKSSQRQADLLTARSKRKGHGAKMRASKARQKSEKHIQKLNKRKQEINVKLADLGVDVNSAKGLVGKNTGRQIQQFDKDIESTGERIKELESQEKNLEKGEKAEFLAMTADQTIPQRRRSNLTGGTVVETRRGVVRDGNKVFRKNTRNSVERTANRNSFKSLGLG